MRYVYFFGAGKADGDGDMRDLLGGKGAGLAEMTRIGLPVPAGFTITTETCDYYLKHHQKYPDSLRKEVKKHVAHLESVTKKKPAAKKPAKKKKYRSAKRLNNYNYSYSYPRSYQQRSYHGYPNWPW